MKVNNYVHTDAINYNDDDIFVCLWYHDELLCFSTGQGQSLECYYFQWTCLTSVVSGPSTLFCIVR